VDQESVDEGEQRVDRIERGAPAAAAEAEALILGADQSVEGAEVDVGRLALQATERVGRLLHSHRALGPARDIGEAPLGSLERARSRYVHAVAVIPQGAADDGALVERLADDQAPDDRRAAVRVVGAAVLLAAQQHVARDRAFDPGEELALLAQEGDRHPLLGAEAEQGRAERDPAEADQAAQGVDRHAGALGAVDRDHDVGAVLVQVRALGGDVEGVEVPSHGGSGSSIRRCSQAATGPGRASRFGRQSWSSEQVSQRFAS
jgi:hypothetical protein